MTRRVLATDVGTVELVESTAPGVEVLAGAPTAGYIMLSDDSRLQVGVWEMSEGTAADIEQDEVFVVLTGEGTLTVEDGETIQLTRGVAVRLHAGDRTTWTVTVPLRKIFFAIE